VIATQLRARDSFLASSVPVTPASRALTSTNTESKLSRKAVIKQVARDYCDEDMVKPCSHYTGRDCVIMEEANGCLLCACPDRSPARGCLGPVGWSKQDYWRLLYGSAFCESGRRAQSVIRYYRKIDVEHNIDDCQIIMQPYCGFEEDANFKRMPRTKSECYHYCFSDEELTARGITAPTV